MFIISHYLIHFNIYITIIQGDFVMQPRYYKIGIFGILCSALQLQDISQEYNLTKKDLINVKLLLFYETEGWRLENKDWGWRMKDGYHTLCLAQCYSWRVLHYLYTGTVSVHKYRNWRQAGLSREVWRVNWFRPMRCQQYNHKGSLNHFGSFWPQKLHHFGNLWLQK